MHTLEEKAVRLLGGIVETETLRSYIRLLATSNHPSEEEIPHEELDGLLRAGMVQTGESGDGRPSCLTPVPMDVVLQHTLVGLAQQALADYQRLLCGYQRMCDLSAATAADGTSASQLTHSALCVGTSRTSGRTWD